MEIKPQELRSGNLLMGQPFNCARVGYGDGVVAITAYGIGLIESDPNFGKNFKPIELTPEWLTRLGFTKRDDNYFDGVSFTEYRIGMFAIGNFNGQGYLLDAFDSMPPMRYVHQLQNLFYSLTGEELAIDKNLSQN